MKKILIFEPLAGGHRGNFLECIEKGIPKYSKRDIEYIFVISEGNASLDREGIYFDRVPDNKYQDCFGIELKWELWALLKLKCKEHKPDQVLIMELTQLEWPLLFWRCPVPLSAILFVQYPEMNRGLKRWFKAKKTAWLLKRNDVRQLFLLNGGFSADFFNRGFPGGTEFIAIPDPLVPLPEQRQVQPAIKWSKTVFLYFGAISRRKGFGLLVDAMLKLTAEEHGRMKFVFCGRPEDPGYFDHELGRLQRSGLPINLDVCKRFLSEEEMFNRFLGSDVVLMPYLRPEYSSGVLGIAAQTMRPVIGPDRGLLGRLINEHGLGKACRMDSRSLKDALLEAVISGVELNLQTAANFVEKSSQEKFATYILHGVESE